MNSHKLLYIAQRILQLLPVVFLVLTLNFFLIQQAPGDMADVMAGESGGATPEYMESLRQQFGTDQPVWNQYTNYLWKISQGDLGWSYRYNQPVVDLIVERIPTSALLMFSALALAAVLGCLLGLMAALTKSRVVDWLLSSISIIGFATPVFWTGLIFMVIFSVKLGWFPSSGFRTLGSDKEGFDAALDIGKHLVLPMACLTLYYLAIYVNLMRSSALDILKMDFIQTAKAKGLAPWRIVKDHVFPNAMLPLVTMSALQFGTLFSGSITIETVFGWPGLGSLTLYAVASRDMNLLLGILLMSSIFVLLVNLVTDLIYAAIDPRVNV